MPIDPQAQQVLDAIAAQTARAPQPPRAPTERERVESTRQAVAGAAQMAGEPEAVDRVEDRRLPGPAGDVPVRIYRPEGARAALMWLHGGSFVAGDLDGYDVPLRAIANRGRVAVISVAWRLAPEHPFPAGLDDALAVLRWMVENGATAFGAEPARILVGGDSAGGALAAAVALRTRDEGPPLAGQVLVYPNTDLTGEGSPYPSWREHDGKVLLRADMEKNFALYVGDGDAGDPLISPIRAKVGGLPRTLIVTAEFDPQRDEGEAYAERLRAAGVTVEHVRYPGMIHGFLQMGGAVDAAHRLTAQIGAWVAAV